MLPSRSQKVGIGSKISWKDFFFSENIGDGWASKATYRRIIDRFTLPVSLLKIVIKSNPWKG